MLTVEFHCHTIYSKDSLVDPRDLVETGRHRGIDRIVVTDHNVIAGAQAAQRLDPGRVIVGEEVMTTQGELLAAFVTERIPAGLSPLEAIARLRSQDAFISVSHPFDRTRNGSWDPDDLLAILPYVDAIEVFNARCLTAQANQQAQDLAHKKGIPGTVGSDAHTLLELGRAVMKVPEFIDAVGLRQSLSQGTIETRLSSPFIHFTSRWAVWYKAWKKVNISNDVDTQEAK